MEAKKFGQAKDISKLVDDAVNPKKRSFIPNTIIITDMCDVYPQNYKRGEKYRILYSDNGKLKDILSKKGKA